MNLVANVLIAIAEELAGQAKASMPKLRNGEKIYREWYDNGIYHRETKFDGKLFHNQYDFRLRQCS